jgi:hypothetical protein
MIVDVELGPLERQLGVVHVSSAQIAEDDADVILAVGRPTAVARCRRPAPERRPGGRRASRVRAELPDALSMTRTAGQPTNAPEICPGEVGPWFLGDNGCLGTKRPADVLGGLDEPLIIQAAAELADEGLT